MDSFTSLLHRAGSQHGLVTTGQLTALGIDRHRLHRLRHQGILVDVHPRVLRLAGAAPTAAQQLLAACLATGGHASHASALHLHGVDQRLPAPPPELVVLRSAHRTRVAGATLHSTTWLPADDVTSVDGIPTTTVARALLQEAGRPKADPDAVRDLVDLAVREGKASDGWLWWRLERIRRRGRPGIAVMERILVDRSGGRCTESWLERQFLTLCADHGLPRPTCQRRIHQDGAFLARVDFLFEPAPVIAEVNGHRYHASPAELSRDARRRNALQLAGYQVLDFTYDDVVRNGLEVVRSIRQALAQVAA